MASLIARRRSILKPYYYSSSSYACLFSHASRNPTNRDLGTNPTIPIPIPIPSPASPRASISPPTAAFNFGGAGFDRGLGAAMMKARFSASATTRGSEPDKCKMMEPDCKQSRASISRPKAAFDPTRKSRPRGLPRAIKFSSARSSTRESESETEEQPWVSDPVKCKMIEDILESIHTKNNVILALSLAEVVAAAWGYHLNPGSPQSLQAASNWFSFAVFLAIAARYTLKFSNLSPCKDPYILGAGLCVVNLVFMGYMVAYGVAVFLAAQRLAALL